MKYNRFRIIIFSKNSIIKNMFVKQGKSNLKYILIVVVLAIIVGGVIVWNYWLVLREKKLQIEKPQKKEMVELENRLYRKKITFDLKNTETLKNFQISLKLDTLSLIREGKLSLDCGNIRFTDSDGKTKIPYWIKGRCGQNNTEIWLRIPEILPNERKSIYIYYGDANKPSASNFDEVFIKADNHLVAWYYLNNLETKTVLDFSGNKNKGRLFGVDYIYAKKHYVVFSNWERSWEGRNTYFEIPAESLNFNKTKGSIEMWVMPRKELAELCAEKCPKRYQRLVIDTNWQIELGINPNGDLYFYPAQAPKDNYNMIASPLKSDEWNHIIVTWNFENKEVTFYINGEKKKNYVENVPKYWKKVAQTGNWQFGGTSLGIDSFFAGYIDGIRIYSKTLDDKEAKSAYHYNSEASRYPKISFGEEELVSVEKATGEVFNPSLVKNINLTDKIKLKIYYATPLDIEYRLSRYPNAGVYIEQSTNEHLFLIPKNIDEYIPIFGVPSHFFPYEGADVEFKDYFLLSYVGLKINNPKLIKDLKIELKKVETYQYGINNKYFEKLIPVVYACGPFHSYKVVGESEFSLIEEKEGIYWYKLKNPVFVDKETTMIQLYYKPSGEEGKLSIQIADMVFTDKNKKLVRPTISIGEDQEWEFEGYGKHPVKNYLAYLAKEEKGFIIFKQNLDTQKLDLSFENRGEDSIIIDNQSIWNIETQSIRWKVKDIKIQDLNNNIIYKISIEEIKNHIFGKKIEPGQTVKIPLASLQDLQTNTPYYITIGTGEESQLEEITNQKRIIRWIFGNNPYYYPRYRSGNDLYLYRLSIGQDGSISFEELR
jgi:hypothetical protein